MNQPNIPANEGTKLMNKHTALNEKALYATTATDLSGSCEQEEVLPKWKIQNLVSQLKKDRQEALSEAECKTRESDLLLGLIMTIEEILDRSK